MACGVTHCQSIFDNVYGLRFAKCRGVQSGHRVHPLFDLEDVVELGVPFPRELFDVSRTDSVAISSPQASNSHVTRRLLKAAVIQASGASPVCFTCPTTFRTNAITEDMLAPTKFVPSIVSGSVVTPPTLRSTVLSQVRSPASNFCQKDEM